MISRIAGAMVREQWRIMGSAPNQSILAVKIAMRSEEVTLLNVLARTGDAAYHRHTRIEERVYITDRRMSFAARRGADDFSAAARRRTAVIFPARACFTRAKISSRLDHWGNRSTPEIASDLPLNR